MRKYIFTTLAVLAAIFTACTQETLPDRDNIMKDINYLAADDLQGRLVGTSGNKKARKYILERYEDTGLAPLKKGTYEMPFTFDNRSGEKVQGVNVIGKIQGQTEKIIIVSAHYDHIGVKDGKIYNGADDNASGVAGMLAIARYFSLYKPKNTLWFVAFDAEEGGLRGARDLAKNLPVAKKQIIAIINLDMISRSDKDEIYAAGTYHYPELRPLLENAVSGAGVTVKLGHDNPDSNLEDWTSSSDHGPFHSLGIPFVYFGVEDHPDYHRHTDTADKIDPGFVEGTTRAILSFIKDLDQAS